jgi:uncharacterized glyoxalase superfamily protein PhnB/uncharacterized protein YndB with AHSA1/START domain
MAQIIPYLKFNGNCEEAMTFYKESLDAELELQKVENSPVASQMPPEAGKRILHSMLTKGSMVLMASDMIFQGNLEPGNVISLTLNCDSSEEINKYFEKLSGGGEILYPLKEEFWGATHGQVKDKFGFVWMLNQDKKSLVAEPGLHTITDIWEFDAPIDLVFSTMTDPFYVKDWWGPARFSTQVDQMNVVPGGSWRFIQKDYENNEYAFHGVYHTVLKPTQLVYTFEFEGMPGHVLMETINFIRENNKTKVISTSVFQSVEDRNGMFKSGAEEGSSESQNRLATLLGKLKTK